MPARVLSRRSALLLPLLLAACGSEPVSYAPLRYDYLPQIRLNVAQVEVRQDFVPLGVSPDVTPLDPVQPVDVLRQMAQDRLKPFGAAGAAVAVIQNASLIRAGDTITGTLAMRLDIYASDNKRVGYAEARVSRQHVGHVDDIHQTLYDMTKQMMDAMNVELEYQIKRSLRDWIVPETGGPAAVQQQPLLSPGAAPPPPVGAPPPLPSGVPPSYTPGSTLSPTYASPTYVPPPTVPAPPPASAPGSLAVPPPIPLHP
jgi:hypothetical protein